MTFIILLLGLGAGVLVGLLGIGGGVVLVPAMVYLLHMDQHMAQGTSLLILLPPIGLGALREYWKQGHVDLPAGILCALGMLFGAYVGSLIALPIPSRHLKGALFLDAGGVLALEKYAARFGRGPQRPGECWCLRRWDAAWQSSWSRACAELPPECLALVAACFLCRSSGCFLHSTSIERRALR
jgi:uncharacterized membrane protein YfcA